MSLPASSTPTDTVTRLINAESAAIPLHLVGYLCRIAQIKYETPPFLVLTIQHDTLFAEIHTLIPWQFSISQRPWAFPAQDLPGDLQNNGNVSPVTPQKKKNSKEPMMHDTILLNVLAIAYILRDNPSIQELTRLIIDLHHHCDDNVCIIVTVIHLLKLNTLSDILDLPSCPSRRKILSKIPRPLLRPF